LEKAKKDKNEPFFRDKEKKNLEIRKLPSPKIQEPFIPNAEDVGNKIVESFQASLIPYDKGKANIRPMGSNF
jgi:hypothetical protein